MPSKTEYAYIAGLLDGEGSICLLKRNKYGCVRFTVQVVNTDYSMIKYIKRTLGYGKIYMCRAENTAKNNKQAYQIRFTKPEIKKLLHSTMPYLRIKLPQAKLLLKYFKLMDCTTAKDSWRLKEVDYMTSVFAKMNKRGL